MIELTRNRGYAIIGLQNPSKIVNIGHALRAAGAMNGKMVAVAKASFKDTVTDTAKAYRHVPLVMVEELKEVIPYDCTPVAVELLKDAKPLHEYHHPERAFYIFGPEEGVIDDYVLDYCKERVYIPSNYSLNMGVTVNIILYDRLAKQLIDQKVKKNRSEIFR
ncbi:MAG: TrmH family RNA methyltransferase [Cyanobacteriota bacterium]